MDEGTRTVLARHHVVAVALALVGVAFLGLALSIVLGKAGWGYDFEAYFRAAQRIPRNELYESWMMDPFSPGMYGYYMYAPPLAVVVVPFTAVSLPAATMAWFLLRVALLGAACAVMPVRPTTRLLVFAVGAFSQPVLQDLVLGNVSLLVVVALAFTWRGLDRPMGSVAAAIAMSVRPTLGVLLFWWGLRHRWRPLLYALLAGMLLVMLTLPIVGTEAWTDYLAVLRNVSQVSGVTNNLDLASTVLRFNVDPIVATAALYGGYAIAIGASLWSLRYDRDLSFMVTIGATLLLAPLLWDHYLASLLLPAAFLAHRGRTWGLALPLLAWLPAPLLPLVAIAGTLAPFLAERRPGTEPAAMDRGGWRQRRGTPGVVPARTPAVVPAPAVQGPAEPALMATSVPPPQLDAAPPIGSNTTSSPG